MQLNSRCVIVVSVVRLCVGIRCGVIEIVHIRPWIFEI